MPPKTDITVSMNHQLVTDLEQLAEDNGTNRSAEIAVAAMIWVNAMIQQGELDRAQLWQPDEFHEEARSLV